ncbi:MAG: HD domain-containing phosphohydrolase [Acidimicrobiia bacterium]
MAFVVAPGAVPAPPPAGSPVTALVVLGGVVAAGRVSWRHLRMYRIGRRPASLVSSVAVGVLGVVPLVFLGGPEFGAAWWLAHGLDIAAVFIACAGIAIAYRADRPLLDVLAPVVVRDPLVALELGLAPEVRAFVEAIGRKDELTRAHVVRVAELSMRVGERARLSPERLRALGLGGLLHDIGKLVVPDAVLQKPGQLDADERAVIQTHTTEGARMLERASEALRPVAPLVRWHHERHDGTGYPDGLTQDGIPLEVGIISVCDAWDAMTTLRHYREGLSPLQASTILREGAGSQWSTRCVELVLSEIAASGPVEIPVLVDLGRNQSVSCACPDALPEALLIA